jgi:signal transduction histidine kinase
MLKVLIIDDQPAVRTALETLFEVHGLPALSVSTPDEALHLIATEDIGAVVQDMNFTQENTDGAEGTQLYRSIRGLDPDMPVMLMTAWTSLEAAVALIKEGAALDTIEERAAHLMTFLDGYSSFARLPQPARQAVPWQALLPGVEGSVPERPAYLDPAQLQQVLINLLKNAAESGSPPDEVAVTFTADSREGVVMEVLDRGKGMTDEVLRNALLPFYSTKKSGTGLGLALCREIVDAHGGRLSLHHRQGGGVAVRCWLPAQEGT